MSSALKRKCDVRGRTGSARLPLRPPHRLPLPVLGVRTTLLLMRPTSPDTLVRRRPLREDGRRRVGEGGDEGEGEYE